MVNWEGGTIIMKIITKIRMNNGKQSTHCREMYLSVECLDRSHPVGGEHHPQAVPAQEAQYWC